MMDKVTRGFWASACCNNKFMLIETWSGYRGIDRQDYKGVQNHLTPSASDEELGLAVFNALAASRWVLPVRSNDGTDPAGVEYDLELYDYKLVAERYTQWINALMERYNYKTKRALFKDMVKSLIEVKEGIMKITPMRQVKLEHWESLGPNNEGTVECPANSIAAEIGAALRLAFSRCTE